MSTENTKVTFTDEPPPKIRHHVPPPYDIASLDVGKALIVKLDDESHAETVRGTMRRLAAKLVNDHPHQKREYITRLVERKDPRWPAVGCWRIK